jgi:hypothetical protein
MRGSEVLTYVVKWGVVMLSLNGGEVKWSVVWWSLDEGNEVLTCSEVECSYVKFKWEEVKWSVVWWSLVEGKWSVDV